MNPICSGCIGVGFILPAYDQWVHQSYFNNCSANATYIYTNSYYRASQAFADINTQYRHATTLQERGQNWCQSRDKLIVEMNMFTMKGKVICMKYTKDNEYKQHPFVFEINLPDNVAIMVDTGPARQTVKVIDQEFKYIHNH